MVHNMNTYCLVFEDNKFLKAATAAKKSNLNVDVHSIKSTLANCTDVRYYLASDALSGFGISSNNELVSVFSAVKGRGSNLVKVATILGASHLNCWEIPNLVKLYKSRGFFIYNRIPNWNDHTLTGVVYMRLGA